MPGPDPRKNRKEGKRMGPKTFVVGKDGKREVLKGGKPVKEMPEQPTIQLPPKKLLTGGQSKIAKKAPPFNKIDEKDFEVLRAEKAKGRGKGLQDEKVKPGKVMKAKKGKLTNLRDLAKGKGLPAPLMANPKFKFKDAGKFPAINTAPGSVASKAKTMSNSDEFIKRRKKLSRSVTKGASNFLKRRGRIGAVLATGLAGISGAKKLLDKRKAKKRDIAKVKKMGGGLAAATARLKAQGKMGGGMMKRPMSYNKGGGADYMNTVKAKKRGNPPVLGLRPNRKLERDKVPNPKKRMGGGMMQKPMPLMGYKKGKMIMARGCKLGRKKATKIT